MTQANIICLKDFDKKMIDRKKRNAFEEMLESFTTQAVAMISDLIERRNPCNDGCQHGRNLKMSEINSFDASSISVIQEDTEELEGERGEVQLYDQNGSVDDIQFFMRE